MKTRLKLNKESLRSLTQGDLDIAHGGMQTMPRSQIKPPPPPPPPGDGGGGEGTPADTGTVNPVVGQCA